MGGISQPLFCHCVSVKRDLLKVETTPLIHTPVSSPQSAAHASVLRGRGQGLERRSVGPNDTHFLPKGILISAHTTAGVWERNTEEEGDLVWL